MIRFADNDIVSNPGSPIKVLYAPVVSEDGSIELEEAGVENTDEIIESFKESCDMNVIINRFMNGEESALFQREGMYGDFTNMPKTYAEMLQLQIDSNRFYDSLPTNIKEKFDNDVNKFFATSGTEEWYEKLGYVKEIKESEVKIEE